MAGYNRLPDIAKAMGLQMEHDSTLWKDEALVVLDKAVMHSFSWLGLKEVLPKWLLS